MKLLLKGFSILYVLLSFVWSANAQNPEYTLESADSLFKQYKLNDSYNTYLNIANNPAHGASARVKAYQQLAIQGWKFYHNYPGAIKALQQGGLLNNDIYEINLLLASINFESKNYSKAELYANKSLELAKNDIEKINSGLLFAKIIEEQGFDSQVSDKTLNRQDLKKAMVILDHALEKQPGNPDASEALIGVGLLLKDGNAAIKGWKSYYLVSDEKNINQAISPGFQLLKPILTKWAGEPLSVVAMKKLAVGFADSRFFNYAGWLADEIKKKDAKAFLHSQPLQDIAAYRDYIEHVKKVNDKIYPEVALGRSKYEDAYDSLMNKAGIQLWNKLSVVDKSQKFDPDSLYNILNRKYGMEGYTGNTVNYYGMLMGHIVHRELKQINQYGYSTKFTYISVDRLISRDFTSWYGTTNVGGWGDSTTIIQVRKAYMTEPFQELGWMADPEENNKVRTLIEKKKQEDLEICKKDPYAEPKFLALYLKFNEASKIYKRLTDSGLRGMELNIGFIDEILRLTVASTVFAHEGRHAIDQLYFPMEFKAMTDDERELRAKFSEVIYSLDPKMAFTGSILGSDLDENTNHGKANKRFRKIIVHWMSEHQSEINGLDKNVPLLMQFDLLTDDQLIAICRSADPLAKNIVFQ